MRPSYKLCLLSALVMRHLVQVRDPCLYLADSAVQRWRHTGYIINNGDLRVMVVIYLLAVIYPSCVFMPEYHMYCISICNNLVGCPYTGAREKKIRTI